MGRCMTRTGARGVILGFGRQSSARNAPRICDLDPSLEGTLLLRLLAAENICSQRFSHDLDQMKAVGRSSTRRSWSPSFKASSFTLPNYTRLAALAQFRFRHIPISYSTTPRAILAVQTYMRAMHRSNCKYSRQDEACSSAMDSRLRHTGIPDRLYTAGPSSLPAAR